MNIQWPSDDIRRAFVAGAKFWEYHQTNFTMWNSDIDICEEEAEKRYPDGKIAFIPIELRLTEFGESGMNIIEDCIKDAESSELLAEINSRKITACEICAKPRNLTYFSNLGMGRCLYCDSPDSHIYLINPIRESTE